MGRARGRNWPADGTALTQRTLRLGTPFGAKPTAGLESPGPSWEKQQELRSPVTSHPTPSRTGFRKQGPAFRQSRICRKAGPAFFPHYQDMGITGQWLRLPGFPV